MGGTFIEEFCGLRSKMYSIQIYGGEEKKTAKGVPVQVKNDEITHEDYKNCLLDEKARFHEGTKIFQKDHQLFTANVAKKTLSPYNDKKYISFENGEFTCYSFGHYKIDKHRKLYSSINV